jgi:hypothetical protein
MAAAADSRGEASGDSGHVGDRDCYRVAKITLNLGYLHVRQYLYTSLSPPYAVVLAGALAN